MEALINKQAKVSNFITAAKKWNLQDLHNILPDNIIDKLSVIPIPLNNIEDKIAWKFTTHSEFPVKT